MKQLWTALVASGLVVGCAIAPSPLSLKTATLQLSMSGLFPSTRQLQYLVPGTRARVTVVGPGLTQPLVQNAPISGETSQITLSGVPTGPNRIVTVETLDEADQPVPGGRYRTTLNLVEGANAGTLSVASTVRGDVFDALLAAKSDLARTLDATVLQAKIDEIQQTQRVAHYGLLDGAAIANQLVQNGGHVESLDKGNAAWVQAPTRLTVKVTGLPDELQAAVWVNDPVSPKQSGISNGTLAIQPVKPGSWQLYARAGSLRVGPIPVELKAAATASVDFSTSQVLAPLAQARSGAASGVLTVGGHPVLVMAGGSLMEQSTNKATDSVMVFDGTSWSPRATMSVAVSHPAFATSGNKLYVLGGWSNAGLSDAVQVYDADKDEWSTPLPALKYKSFMGGAACVNGHLYLMTGITQDGDFWGPDWSLYSVPLDGSATGWSASGMSVTDPQLRVGRWGSAVATLGGKIYAFGGSDDQGYLMHRVECYDPVKSTVRELAPMPTARHGAFAWAKNGKVYVMGGIDAMGQALANVEVYDPVTDTWDVLPRLREPRGHAAVGEVGGKVVVAGGNDGYYAAGDVSLRSSVESLVF